MVNFIEIKPCVGIGDLKFGASALEAEEIYGKPDNIELLDEIEESKSTVFHYWESGFSLFFDENKNQLFCCVEVDNKTAVLWEKQVFKLDEKGVVELLQSKGFHDFESEMHDWGEKRLSFEGANMDFYFEKNKLVSINYGQSIQTTNILILPN